MATSKLELGVGDVSVTIDLADGGRVVSLVLGGEELLITDDPALHGHGSFPMAPWAGRLDRGRFNCDDQQWSVPINLEPHAIHGTAVEQDWSISPATTRPAPGAAQAVSIETDLGATWPLGGRASQRFVLTEDHVRCELSVHAADKAMPAMVGWHPWFRRTLSSGTTATLTFDAESMYELDDAAIPTGALIPPPPGPWDNCFTGVVGDPSIAWGGERRIVLTSSCTDWVVYDQPEHAICVEPQSGPPNQFNRNPRILQPGETLTEWFEIHFGGADG